MTEPNNHRHARRDVEVQRPTVEVDGMPLSDGFPIRKLVLKILSGPESGQIFVGEGATVRLGADPLCDVVLTDPTVSRHHAEVRRRGQRFFLVDLNSTNGTFIDHDRCLEPTEVKTGQAFRLGRTRVSLDVKVEKVEIATTSQTNYDDIIGQSQALREIFSILDRISPSELSVVIEGETGSGKELIAKAIHDHSQRSKGPFIVFDCSAFPPNLLESELFGHEKGAFTGAVGRHAGVFEQADGGTLFFDELGELDLEFQAKFLRVLETGQLRRVGGEKVIKVDVRVVAATNRNLQTMVAERRFRQDLFYRLAQVRFLLPPLRERFEDIPLLVEHFLDHLAERSGRRPMISMNAIAALQNYRWPGNIRQLRNVVEKAVAMCTDGVIDADYMHRELAQQANLHQNIQTATSTTDASLELPVFPSSPQPYTPPKPTPAPVVPGTRDPQDIARDGISIHEFMTNGDDILPFKEVKEAIISSFEVQYIEVLLSRTKNISEAARKAGIDRRHFYRLLNKHGLADD